jgi:hypothetical protein
VTHYPSRLRFKLPAERIAELVENNSTILSDDEWMQFFEQVNIISVCDKPAMAEDRGLLAVYNDLKRGQGSPHNPTRLMIKTIIRTAIRTRLINDGPQTCSDLVRSMGLDPRRHKGTIHALMVDLEKDGVLGATRADNGKRDLWFVNFEQIRKRDRIIAALSGI